MHTPNVDIVIVVVVVVLQRMCELWWCYCCYGYD